MLPFFRWFNRSWALDQHSDELNEQHTEPDAGDPGKPIGGKRLTHLLHEPGTAVHGCKDTCVQTEIHDPLEMAVRRIGWVSRAVPADRHLDDERSSPPILPRVCSS